MSLNSEQLARILAAGSVPIPALPGSGQVSAEVQAYTIAGGAPEPTLQVVLYPSPGHKNTFTLTLRDVTAIFLPDGFTPGAGPLWLLGEEVRSAPASLNPLAGAGRPGTVFAREQAGVLMTVESALTAAEVAAIPGCCL